MNLSIRRHWNLYIDIHSNSNWLCPSMRSIRGRTFSGSFSNGRVRVWPKLQVDPPYVVGLAVQ